VPVQDPRRDDCQIPRPDRHPCDMVRLAGRPDNHKGGGIKSQGRVQNRAGVGQLLDLRRSALFKSGPLDLLGDPARRLWGERQ
jgi:hypothetical protein